MQNRASLILASSSPRRLALLRQVGVIPDRIQAPEVDETPLARELPRAHVLRLAEAKVSDVARRPEAGGAYVLAADTVVACGRRAIRVAQTVVRFKRLHEREIASYLACGEWRGKAGGYAIQGLFGAFVPEIVGSYTNVVGLPLYETRLLLEGAGFQPAWGAVP